MKRLQCQKAIHPGRLIHADMAGPFRRSAHGGYQYFLILIDDHSRYKSVYFLQQKSEAPAHIRNFVAKLNAITNKGKQQSSKVMGTLHTNNAGEFLSREFTEMLDEELVSHTRCPAYVHQLNGVAERSIRTVLENVRANLVASKSPVSFWPYMVEHAVDCINRTTGPPGSEITSFESLTGEKPKVMSILPYGCLAYAVKPRAAFSKTNLDPRAWVGTNLGRAAHTPGAYNIWIPEKGKVVCTSEVYFDETFMPWRPCGDQREGAPMPVAPPPPADSDAHATHTPNGGGNNSKSISKSHSASAPQAYDEATRDANGSPDPAIARASNKVLILFSGPYARPPTRRPRRFPEQGGLRGSIARQRSNHRRRRRWKHPR